MSFPLARDGVCQDSATKMTGQPGHWSEPGEYNILLRWHVCRVNFARKIFSSHVFSYEKCSEIFPENFEPLFCGSEKIPGKFPPNFPLNFPNFPAKNQKKVTDELLQERRENILFLGSVLVISSQDSSALGYREFTQEGAMTISPFAAREGTGAPQWPIVKKCCCHLVPSSDFFVQSYAVPKDVRRRRLDDPM